MAHTARGLCFAGRHSGFTIIELTLVVVIVGVLAAIAVPRLAT